MNERLLLALPHRQFLFTFPKLLRPYFRHNRRLFAEVSQLIFAILQRFYDKAAKNPVRNGPCLPDPRRVLAVALAHILPGIAISLLQKEKRFLSPQTIPFQIELARLL
jgi:hypothetical protein